MKTLLFCLLFSVAIAVEDIIKVDLIQQSIHKDVFVKQQAKRMEKWGKAARSLPKYHEKLLEVPYKNDFITTYVQFGTPVQNFSVMISSGATRAWLIDTSYQQRKSGQNGYSPKDSSTSNKLGKSFNQIDGSFTASGVWYTDDFQFGKAKVKSQAFGDITYFDEPYGGAFPVDGVFGIARFADVAYTSGEPVAPIDNIFTSTSSPKKFTLFLDKQVAPSKGSSKGALTIGGFDNTHCDENALLAEFKFNRQATSDSRLINMASPVQFGFRTLSGGFVYIDSGVSTIQLPANDLQTIYDTLKPAYDWQTGFYTVPCDKIGDFDYLYLFFDNYQMVDVRPSEYVVDLDIGNNQCALALELVSSQYTSVSYVVGSPFAQRGCLVYNYETKKVSVYEPRK